MTDPRSFGAWLRRERERREITLRAIADRTKIGTRLLEGLERGDVSRWPAGIYRRAFVRGYADAVGLDADLILANFERLFPDGTTEAPAPNPPAAIVESDECDEAEELGMRLQLADARPAFDVVVIRTVTIDIALMLGMALGGLMVAGWIGFWCAAAVTTFVQHVGAVLGLPRHSVRAAGEEERPAAARPLAPVVSFSDDPARSTSRRARARRMAATLSAVAIPAASFRRRRAARS